MVPVLIIVMSGGKERCTQFRVVVSWTKMDILVPTMAMSRTGVVMSILV